MLLVDQLYKGQIAKLSIILDSFYITITNDYTGVRLRVVGNHEVAGLSTHRS